MSGEPPTKKARSGKHVSSGQIHHLLLFLEDHPDLALPCSNLNNRFSAHDRARLWGEVAEILNGVGPATKDGTGWRRYWMEIIAQTKKKSSTITEALTSTGSGKLPGMGDRVLQLIGREVVEGCCPAPFLQPPATPSTSHQAAPTTPLDQSITAPQVTRGAPRPPTSQQLLNKIAEDQHGVVEAIKELRETLATSAREAAEQRERQMNALINEQKLTTAALNTLAKEQQLTTAALNRLAMAVEKISEAWQHQK